MPPLPPFEELDPWPNEPDIHYRCRWVSDRDYDPREPDSLAPFRKMIKTTPLKFYELYQREQAKMERIDAEEAAIRAAAEGTTAAGADKGSAKCLALIDELLAEIGLPAVPASRGA